MSERDEVQGARSAEPETVQIVRRGGWARTRYWRSQPFAGSAHILPTPAPALRDTGSWVMHRATQQFACAATYAGHL